MRNINEVELVGNIVDVFYKDDYFAVKIATSRMVYTKEGRELKRQFPRVIWLGEQAKELSEKFKVKDNVKIIAEIDTSRRKKRGESNIRQLSLLGVSIDFAKNDWEERYGAEPTSKVRIEDVNQFSLGGKVVDIYTDMENRNFARLTLRIAHNNRVDYPDVVLFGKPAEFVANLVNVDDFVLVSGAIQTYRKEDGDEVDYRTSLVGNEIALQNGN